MNTNRLYELLSEKMSDGTYKLSFTRFTSMILIIFYIISAIYILVTEHKLIDIPTSMVYMIGGIYGINKIGGGLSNSTFKTNKYNNYDNNNNINKTFNVEE